MLKLIRYVFSTIRVSLIVVVLYGTSAHALERDKQLHVGAGCAIALVTDVVLCSDCTQNEKFVASVSMATAFGLAKELYDRKHKGHTYDPRDAVATSVGGAVCATVSYTF
ncbi:MAG: hypothetical protein WC791_00855 [Candidatus Paceibacterota bacterium]|jgi:hypothetical protein